MVVKEMNGVVLGIDNINMYSIISDDKKSYQLNAEYDLLGLNKDDIIPERKFKMLIDENDEVEFLFLDEYVNKDITIEDLKKIKGIE
jgi:hypothetical protein